MPTTDLGLNAAIDQSESHEYSKQYIYLQNAIINIYICVCVCYHYY